MDSSVVDLDSKAGKHSQSWEEFLGKTRGQGQVDAFSWSQIDHNQQGQLGG